MPNIKKRALQLTLLSFLAIALFLGTIVVQRRTIIQEKATATTGLKTSIVPSEINIQKGQTIDVNVKITNNSTETKSVRGGTVKLSFNPSIVNISGIGASDSPCNSTDFPSRAYAGIYETGKLELSCFRGNDIGVLDIAPNVTKTLGKFKITVKNEAAIGQTFNLAYISTLFPKATEPGVNYAVDLASNVPGTYIIGDGTYTPTATPTEEEEPEPTGPGLTFKLKFREIYSRPGSCYTNTSVKFQVKLVKDGVVQTFSNVVVKPTTSKVTEAGVWSLLVTGFNKTAGRYDVYIKGPRQLQKKFPNVNLTSAEEQTIDLSSLGARYYLEGGDIPAQDGVADSKDATGLVNCFATPDSAACVSKADLNFDCIVNTQDSNIMNNTIFTRWEDDEQS